MLLLLIDEYVGQVMIPIMTGRDYTVQCSTVQYSAVQYSTVQYSTVQYGKAQYSTVQCSTVQYGTAQHSTDDLDEISAIIAATITRSVTIKDNYLIYHTVLYISFFRRFL
jgi:hypothetical protein